MSLTERLAEYVRACFTGLWIESHEHQDALVAIAQLCRQEDWRLATWDIEQGLRVRNICRSPIQGDAGNREFFILLQKPQE